MRVKRNTDLYDGGMEVTVKEVEECLAFVGRVIEMVKDYSSKKSLG